MIDFMQWFIQSVREDFLAWFMVVVGIGYIVGKLKE